MLLMDVNALAKPDHVLVIYIENDIRSEVQNGDESIWERIRTVVFQKNTQDIRTVVVLFSNGNAPDVIVSMRDFDKMLNACKNAYSKKHDYAIEKNKIIENFISSIEISGIKRCDLEVDFFLSSGSDLVSKKIGHDYMINLLLVEINELKIIRNTQVNCYIKRKMHPKELYFFYKKKIKVHSI